MVLQQIDHTGELIVRKARFLMATNNRFCPFHHGAQNKCPNGLAADVSGSPEKPFSARINPQIKSLIFAPQRATLMPESNH